MYGLSVFVVTTGDCEILHRFVESDWLTSDAISLSGISIDTVSYRLANDVTAFGVRTTRGNPGVEVTTLDLYVAGAGNLKRVRKGLNAVSQQSESRYGHGCHHASTTDRTVAIATSNLRAVSSPKCNIGLLNGRGDLMGAGCCQSGWLACWRAH